MADNYSVLRNGKRKTRIPGISRQHLDRSGSYLGGPASPAQPAAEAAAGIRSKARGRASGSGEGEEPVAYLDIVRLLDLGLGGGRVDAQHVVVTRVLHHFRLPLLKLRSPPSLRPNLTPGGGRIRPRSWQVER